MIGRAILFCGSSDFEPWAASGCRRGRASCHSGEDEHQNGAHVIRRDDVVLPVDIWRRDVAGPH